MLGSEESDMQLGKLPQLQNLVKRDPEGYREDFLMQFRHYESEYTIFLLQPTKESEHFGNLISFLSHVARCYPVDMKNFPLQLIELLEKHYNVLESNLRKTIVQSLILMRNRDFVDPVVLLKLFFELFRCPDKRLREILYAHIISDIRNINKKHANHVVNRNLQNFLFQMVQDENEVAAKKSLEVLIDLFRRKVWHDERTVNVIAIACTSKITRVMVGAIQFFLGIDKDILEDEEEEEAKVKNQIEVDYHAHSKKTKKRHRQTRNALLKNKKARNKEFHKHMTFPAIELLNDPQGVAERQLKILKGSLERFEVKLLMMDFISRLIGFHKLIVLNFYPLVQKYLHSHQQRVTNILAYLVQACHCELPPDEVEPIVKMIANNFVAERCSTEVIAVGINSLREIFTRIPLVLECEGIDTLISDLIMYRKSRDKSSVIASRGVLNLIREIHPAILKKKERGKFHEEKKRPKQFGELNAAEGVEGADLLAEAEASGRFDNEENEGDEWEVASSASDNSDDEWEDASDTETNNDIEKVDSGNELMDDGNSDTEEREPKKIKLADRIEAKRTLTPRDFERIEMLKKEAEAAAKDPKNRRKNRQQEEGVEKTSIEELQFNPDDLEGYAKRKRQTQEERIKSVLKGREDFLHRKSGGGTTNTEKNRKKHFLMLKKSRKVQSKILLSARQVQRSKTNVVKKILKRDQKKRRRT